MDTKIYYVSVDVGAHLGHIDEQLDENDPLYDFEIEATPAQIDQLKRLFNEMEESDFRTFVKAHIPFDTQKQMQESRISDGKVDAIYRLIYQLGTERTKSAIRDAGLPH